MTSQQPIPLEILPNPSEVWLNPSQSIIPPQNIVHTTVPVPIIYQPTVIPVNSLQQETKTEQVVNDPTTNLPIDTVVEARTDNLPDNAVVVSGSSTQEKYVVYDLSSYVTNGYITLRCFFHAYLFLVIFVIFLIVAVGLQLHFFFTQFVNVQESTADLIFNLFISLTTGLVFSVFAAATWKIVKSAWQGEDLLVYRKMAKTSAPFHSISMTTDIIVQILYIAGLDIIPIIVAFIYCEGVIVEWFTWWITIAQIDAFIIVATALLLELIKAIVGLFSACIKCKIPVISTFREATRQVGDIFRSRRRVLASEDVIKNWVCYALQERFTTEWVGWVIGFILIFFTLYMEGVWANSPAVPVDIPEGEIPQAFIWSFGSMIMGIICLIWSWSLVTPWSGFITEEKLRQYFKVLDEQSPLQKHMEQMLPDSTLGTIQRPRRPLILPWRNKMLLGVYISYLLALLIASIWLTTTLWITPYSVATAVVATLLYWYLYIPYLILSILYLIYTKDDVDPLDYVKVELVNDDYNVSEARPNRKAFLNAHAWLVTLLFSVPLIVLCVAIIIWIIVVSVSVRAYIYLLAVALYILGIILFTTFLSKGYKGFPISTFLGIYAFMIFVYFLIFMAAVIYSQGKNSTGSSDQAAPNGPPIQPTTPEFPICNSIYHNLTVLDYAFFSNLAYDTYSAAQHDLPLWSPGPSWSISYNYTEDVIIQFYEFSTSLDPKLRVLSVRGTHSAITAMNDGDLWAAVVLLQIFDFFLPMLRAWPTEYSRKLIAYISPSYWDGSDGRLHWNALLQRVEFLLSQGLQPVLTGHSLGAGISNIVGALTSVHTVTFSPPGIRWSSYRYGIASTPSLDYYLSQVVVWRDLVSKVDDQAGDVQKIPCNNLNSLLQCHSLDRTIQVLQASCGDPYGREFIVARLPANRLD